jgi:hypothetical protein
MRGRRVRIVALACLVVGSSQRPSTALAWSREGHRIIAMVAADRLHPHARAAVAAMLKRDPHGSTLPKIATWADDVRDSRPQTYNWHFVDIPHDAQSYRATRDCHPDDEASRGDCIIGALDRETSKLRDARVPPARRAEALKFVTHFIGDLHQPLHCADRHDDRGGNRVLVTFFGGAYEPAWSRQRTHWNLHAVWDFGLIEHANRDEAVYARALATWIATQDVHAIESGTLIEWANEAHVLAATHAYRNVDGTPLPVKGARLGKTYYAANIGVVDRQLAKAGVRLAKVLNDAFP